MVTTVDGESDLKDLIAEFSSATAVLVVTDANTRNFDEARWLFYIAHQLGTPNIVWVVNKMDLVDFDQAAFELSVSEAVGYAKQIGLTSLSIVPISGLHGDNIATASENTSWYNGAPLLSLLDNVNLELVSLLDLPLRMPIQTVANLGSGAPAWAVSATILAPQARYWAFISDKWN